MSQQTCASCGFDPDHSDNFCRRCGASLAAPTLPAVRRASPVTVWRPQVSPVVKGAAVMAAGTIGQMVLRRIAGGAFRRGNAKPQRVRFGRDRNDGLVDDAQIITETVMMRRVRIRRQP